MNQFLVLDDEFKLLGVVDNYKSAIWSERLYENGDFELYCPRNAYNYDILRLNANTCIPVYVMRNDDKNKIGILTDVKYTYEVDDGEMIVASGYTDDYLLHYRVIFEQSSYFGNVEYAIRHMVYNAMIHSEFGYDARNATDRIQLGDFVNLDDSYTVNLQFMGDYLDEAIYKMGKDLGLGYAVEFDPSSNIFTFNIINGTNKPNVIFSQNLDNLLSSEYANTMKPNTIYAIGEGSGVDKYVGQYDTGSSEARGLLRHEFYVNGDKVSDNAEGFNILSYVNLLKGQAIQGYADKYSDNENVQSSVAPNSYVYGTDYDLGDIVSVIIGTGLNGISQRKLQQRIIEVVECWDDSGYSCEPTFETVEG